MKKINQYRRKMVNLKIIKIYKKYAKNKKIQTKRLKR